MTIVEVVWDDAWCLEGKHSLSGVECKPKRTKTVGYLLKEQLEGVVVAPEFWPDDVDDVNYPTFIPRGMIVSINPLRGEGEESADLSA